MKAKWTDDSGASKDFIEATGDPAFVQECFNKFFAFRQKVYGEANVRATEHNLRAELQQLHEADRKNTRRAKEIMSFLKSMSMVAAHKKGAE